MHATLLKSIQVAQRAIPDLHNGPRGSAHVSRRREPLAHELDDRLGKAVEYQVNLQVTLK